MLGKLLKYDLKWVYKVVIVFYVLAFIFSCIGRGLSYIENSIIFEVTTQFAFGFAVSMMVSSFINCLMRLWARFIRSVYKDEGYLTHTLPVEKRIIYASKVISAFITIFTTLVVSVVCLFICYYSEGNLETLKGILELAASTYNTTVLNLLALITIVLFLQIMFIVLVGYVAIIVGYQANKNKMLRTIVIGFGLYMLTQIISLVVIYMFGLFNPDVMNLIDTTEMINIDIIKMLMYAAIGLYVIYIAFYYILGKKQLEKGVNVD